MEDRRISVKSLAEQLGISRERVGSIIHEGLDMLVTCFLPGRAEGLLAPRGGNMKSRKVCKKFTVVSEERAISCSRSNKILKMEIGSFSETLINFYQIARRYAPQESDLHLFLFSFCSSVFFGNLG